MKQPNLSSRGSLADDPAVLPFVVLPKGGQRVPGAQGDASSGPSRGWLLDALLENQQRSRFRQGAREGRNVDVPDLASETQRNPLDAYLQTWLSPRDRRILMPGFGEPRSALESLAEVDPNDSWRPRSQIDASPLVADARSGVTVGQPGNPYLETVESTPLGFSVDPISAAPRRSPVVETLSTPTLPQAGGERGSPSQLPQLTPLQPDSSTSVPTAPLVDDQRYFPQLRRF